MIGNDGDGDGDGDNCALLVLVFVPASFFIVGVLSFPACSRPEMLMRGGMR